MNDCVSDSMFNNEWLAIAVVDNTVHITYHAIDRHSSFDIDINA